MNAPILHARYSTGVLSVSKFFGSALAYPARLWAWIFRFLNERAEQEVAAWGSALQYKRRYTNPDSAKRARQVL